MSQDYMPKFTIAFSGDRALSAYQQLFEDASQLSDHHIAFSSLAGLSECLRYNKPKAQMLCYWSAGAHWRKRPDCTGCLQNEASRVCQGCRGRAHTQIANAKSPASIVNPRSEHGTPSRIRDVAGHD